MIAYYLMFYDDLSKSIERARAQETSLHADLATARQNEFAYQRDLAELTERQQRQNVLAKVLPNSTEYPAFLSSLQSVSNTSGITLIAWAPQPEVTEKYYARVPMRLDVEGRFHQIAKFFYGVGQLDLNHQYGEHIDDGSKRGGQGLRGQSNRSGNRVSSLGRD